uniref:Transposase n=1 Tax=Ascaris lumbricoides TaxID=6252 RepID=A0A0M3HTE1_ASCLU
MVAPTCRKIGTDFNPLENRCRRQPFGKTPNGVDTLGSDTKTSAGVCCSVTLPYRDSSKSVARFSSFSANFRMFSWARGRLAQP